MFDIKNRNNPSMDKYMDPKKPPFGGPKERIEFDPKKKSKYQRVIDRDKNFEGGEFNRNYDTTWKAITRDLVSRSVNKKEYNPMYAKPTIATVDAVEEGKIMRFDQFVNESEEGYNMFAEAEEDEVPGMEDMDTDIPAEEPEVDEEKLENLMADHGEALEEMIDEIAEAMEIEKDEVCDLLCAAIKKLVNKEDEDAEGDENLEDVENEDEDLDA